MVRSQGWKLVHFLDQPDGQLFNLQEDPGEIHNLWDDADHEPKKRQLLDVLREWRIRSAWRTQGWSKAWR
jgi:arylsulfatase A-like enzyme